MFVIGLTDYGGPDVLKKLELPEPHVEPGQVRIKVRGAGINPVDVMVRQGKLAPVFEGMDPPYVPGMDVSGTID